MLGTAMKGAHLRPAAGYFALVFAAGFALGCIRVPLLVPRLGVRTAELLELPVMVAVIVLVARARQRRTAALTPRDQLTVGGLAVVFLLAAECALGAAGGRSPHEVLLDRDPVAGPAYYGALAVMALAPWFWARRAVRRGRRTRRPEG